MPLKKEAFIVSVDEDHLKEINRIADQLKKMGFLILRVLPSIGTINVQGERKLIRNVSIAGIDTIENDRKVRIR